MIDICIKSVVQSHDVLQKFCVGRGTGTTIAELKLAQELASVDQDPLLLITLNLSKAYNNLDQGRLLQTIEGYRAGPKLRALIAEFWLIQEVVTCQNGLNGTQLRATRGTIKGGLVLNTLFNVEVYSMVRHWMSITVEDESATNGGLGMAVGLCMGMFYADDGMI